MRPFARLFDDDRVRLRGKVLLLSTGLIAVNFAAWGWATTTFSGDPALLGTALLAYGLGLRHAVDADHIAAIDNVTRKLMQEGKRPIGVGFFFAAGHSTVVIVAGSAIALTAGGFRTRSPALIEYGSTIGAAISACFLLAIGALNSAVFVTVWRRLRRRSGDRSDDQRELESMLYGGGFLARLFRRLFRLIARSWHMYPLGFLFGLGFDTASEIGLLGIAASEAAKGLPPGAILVFPALFMAGMSLIDATDGVLMLGLYGWAFADPVRRLYYNLAVTGISVFVALLVGGIEALGLLGDKLGSGGALWDRIAAIAGEFGMLGYGIVAVFLLTWLASLLIYRLKAPGKIGA